MKYAPIYVRLEMLLNAWSDIPAEHDKGDNHMVGLPKFNRKDDTDQEYMAHPDPQPSTAPSPLSHGQDVLSVLGIQLQTNLEEGVFSPSEIKSAQFRARKPDGYNYDDVDTWHRHVVRTIDWFVSKLHQRDIDVHRLATEIDKNITDLTNLRYELELSRGTHAMPHADPALQLEIQRRDDEIARLAEALERAQNAAPRVAASSAGLSDEERQQFIDLQEWAEQAEESYVQLEERLSTLETEKAELEAEKTTLETSLSEAQSYANQIEEYANQLEGIIQNGAGGEDVRADSPQQAEPVYEETAYEEPVYEEPVRTRQVAQPVYEEASYEESETSGESYSDDTRTQEDLVDEFIEESRSNRYAPELPAGVVLPSQQRPRTATSSGAPISPSTPLRSIPEGADPNDYL